MPLYTSFDSFALLSSIHCVKESQLLYLLVCPHTSRWFQLESLQRFPWAFACSFLLWTYSMSSEMGTLYHRYNFGIIEAVKLTRVLGSSWNPTITFSELQLAHAFTNSAISLTPVILVSVRYNLWLWFAFPSRSMMLNILSRTYYLHILFGEAFLQIFFH